MGLFDFFKKKSNKPDFEKLFLEKESEKAIMEIDEWLNEITQYGQNLSKLNLSQQIVIIIENLEREINNGGFNQFYLNSSGNYANETVDYLKKIGANKTAEIVKRANAEWPNNQVPKDRTERQIVLERIEEKADPIWENCDQDFYKYPDHITDLLLDFVKKNKTDFE